MSSLLANQAIDLAIAGLISAVAALVLSVAGYIQLRGQQIKTSAEVQGVKEQVQHQQAAPAVVQLPPVASTVYVQPTPEQAPTSHDHGTAGQGA